MKNDIKEPLIIQKNDLEFYQSYKNICSSINLISIEATKNNLTLQEYITIVTKYIANNINKPPFALVFDTLLLLNEEDLIIKYLDSQKLSIKYLQDNLYDYMINYRPDILYINPLKSQELRKKFNFYVTYLTTKDMPTIIHKNQSKIETAINKVEDFIKANCSLERYIFINEFSIVDFRNYLKLVNRYKPDLYQQYLEHLNLLEILKNQNIENDVYNILTLIKEKGDKFSSLDFFLNTIYSINEMVKYADKILDILDIKLFRTYINKLSNIRIQRIKNNKFVFNIHGELVEVSDEEKTIIIDFLNENNIPVDVTTFKDAYIKFYNENLLLSKHR